MSDRLFIEEIDAICNRFEAVWQAGRQPQLEEFWGTTRSLKAHHGYESFLLS